MGTKIQILPCAFYLPVYGCSVPEWEDSLRGELTGVRSCHELTCVVLPSARAAKFQNSKITVKLQSFSQVANLMLSC